MFHSKSIDPIDRDNWNRSTNRNVEARNPKTSRTVTTRMFPGGLPVKIQIVRRCSNSIGMVAHGTQGDTSHPEGHEPPRLSISGLSKFDSLWWCQHLLKFPVKCWLWWCQHLLKFPVKCWPGCDVWYGKRLCGIRATQRDTSHPDSRGIRATQRDTSHPDSRGIRATCDPQKVIVDEKQNKSFHGEHVKPLRRSSLPSNQ